MLSNTYSLFSAVGCIFNHIHGLAVVIKVTITAFFRTKLAKNLFYFDKLGRQAFNQKVYLCYHLDI
jgi:hypothetical protein